MQQVTNQDIAAALCELADHLDFSGSDRYAARAYRRAAGAIAQLPVSAAALAIDRRATSVQGIGESIQARIVELCETGTIAALDRMRERTPVDLMLLMRVPGVSRPLALRIWDELDPASLEEVAAAAEDGRLLGVHGVGPRTVDAVRDGIALLLDEPDQVAQPMLRSQAQRAAADVEAVLTALVPDVLRVHVGGELARGHELVQVLDVLVVARDAPAATAALRRHLDARGWHTSSETAEIADECLTFALHGPTGAGLRIHVADPEHEARSLLFCIGPLEHARDVCRAVDGRRHPAPRPGPELPGQGAVAPADEPLYLAAGRAWLAPELRDRVPEPARVPDLVQVSDLRGELHAHSTWSDGRGSIADMASAAVDRGLEYLAITDHSQSLRIAGGLTHGDLAAQWRELEQVRAELPPGFTLLHGTELEILADGALDYPADVLERLDWVAASIHMDQRQPREVITERMEQALRSPYVDCIAHPTSRILLRRDKTALDTDRLIELAAETGTFLEINASPERLDLDSDTAERAAERGVLLCINSDAHRTTTLSLVEHGIAVARRAMLEPRHVANTLGWEELRQLQKRWRT